jgi:hypothetical protein
MCSAPSRCCCAANFSPIAAKALARPHNTCLRRPATVRKPCSPLPRACRAPRTPH